jgi:hypothetical protein
MYRRASPRMTAWLAPERGAGAHSGLARSIDMHLRSYVNPIAHCVGDNPKVEAPCRRGRNGCDATEARSLTTVTEKTKQGGEACQRQ